MASFRPTANTKELIALRALRTGEFARQGEAPAFAVWLDVWVLSGPEAGKFFGESVNTSRLGRQFGQVAGNGQIYYGRVTPEPSGNGISYILGEPQPGDQSVIDLFKAAIAADPFLGSAGTFSLRPGVAPQATTPPPAAAPVDPLTQQPAQGQQAAIPPTGGYAAPPLNDAPPF
jgi:hypothetical protein